MDSISATFYNKLSIIDLGNNKFQLDNSLLYYSNILNRDITVPKGFITDLTSTPRILWPLFPPFGKYSRAAVIHDYLIAYKDTFHINLSTCHNVFLEAMKSLGVGKFKRYLFYYTVKYLVNYGNDST